MVRIVARQHHDGLFDYDEAITTVRRAFEEAAENPGHREKRHRVYTTGGMMTSVHMGAMPDMGGAGALIHGVHSDRGFGDEERTHRSKRTPPVIVLQDAATGELNAIIIGEYGVPTISPGSPGTVGTNTVRTAATSAVGMDALSRADASTLGVFGTMRQARNHLVAFDRARDFDSVTVYSPTRTHRELFAEAMADKVDLDIHVADAPDEVVAGADVILAATSSAKPVFDGSLLEPGQTVVSIVGGTVKKLEAGQRVAQRREVDDETVARADLVVANSVDHARENRQGDLFLPVDRGLVSWDDMVPLREVIAGAHPGRQSDDEVILYKNNSGEGIADIALASLVWQKVEAQDLGVEFENYFPRDWEPTESI